MPRSAIVGLEKSRGQMDLIYVAVSKNSGTPKSSILIILIGISIINHPFLGVPLFLETPMYT